LSDAVVTEGGKNIMDIGTQKKQDRMAKDIALLNKIGSSFTVTPTEVLIAEKIINRATENGWIPRKMEYSHSILEIADEIDAYRDWHIEREVV
jgi:hypothetical protein